MFTVGTSVTAYYRIYVSAGNLIRLKNNEALKQHRAVSLSAFDNAASDGTDLGADIKAWKALGK